MNNKKKRIDYVDVLKAFTIFFVVFGHVIVYCSKTDYSDSIYYAYIIPFHMPLFGMLSGMFVKDKIQAVPFFKSKIRSILLPFLVWCFIDNVIFQGCIVAYNHEVNGADSVHLLGLLHLFWFAIVDWGWWFLRALFLSHIYYFFFLKIFKNKFLLASLLSVVILYLNSFFGVIPNKSTIFIGMIYLYPFIVSGAIFKRYINVVEKHDKLLFFVSLAVYIVCLCFWKCRADSFYWMNTSILEPEGEFDVYGKLVVYKTLYRFVTGLAGSLVFILLFKKLKYSQKFLNVITPIGTNTLGIYIIHGFMLNLSAMLCPFTSNVMLFVYCLITAVVILLISYFFIRLMDRNKLVSLFLFGKKIK